MATSRPPKATNSKPDVPVAVRAESHRRAKAIASSAWGSGWYEVSILARTDLRIDQSCSNGAGVEHDMRGGIEQKPPAQGTMHS
eukprot:scaffold37642_cov30-Tisochrysis_lutea.AAC.6